MNGIFHPQYFVMQQQFSLMDIMESILTSHFETIHNIEKTHALLKAAEEQAQFQMEIHLLLK